MAISIHPVSGFGQLSAHQADRTQQQRKDQKEKRLTGAVKSSQHQAQTKADHCKKGAARAQHFVVKQHGLCPTAQDQERFFKAHVAVAQVTGCSAHALASEVVAQGDCVVCKLAGLC